MKNLVAYDKNLNIIKRGDIITSFRGEQAIFEYATRERQFGKSGKVQVTWVKDNYSMEYYDNVFNLEVYEV